MQLEQATPKIERMLVGMMKNKIFAKLNLAQFEKNLMIELSPAEREKLASEIFFIIENFEKYHSLDLINVKPTHFPIVVKQQLRKDLVITTESKNDIIKVSPNYKNCFIGIKNDN